MIEMIRTTLPCPGLILMQMVETRIYDIITIMPGSECRIVGRNLIFMCESVLG